VDVESGDVHTVAEVTLALMLFSDAGRRRWSCSTAALAARARRGAVR
jgi:hypothetical protein